MKTFLKKYKTILSIVGSIIVFTCVMRMGYGMYPESIGNTLVDFVMRFVCGMFMFAILTLCVFLLYAVYRGISGLIKNYTERVK
jgi:uncharacterized membrane protein